jgi:hypothetical protein
VDELHPSSPHVGSVLQAKAGHVGKETRGCLVQLSSEKFGRRLGDHVAIATIATDTRLDPSYSRAARLSITTLAKFHIAVKEAFPMQRANFDAGDLV